MVKSVLVILKIIYDDPYLRLPLMFDRNRSKKHLYIVDSYTLEQSFLQLCR